MATVHFATLYGERKTSFDFPYSDALFEQPGSTYCHQLAQSSLGMAIAAFRQKDADMAHKDGEIRAYLIGAGFTELESDQYDIAPASDTIASMIGQKTLSDGTNLLAVAVSGGDYAKEWQSNMTIGAEQYGNDDVFHEGFLTAATTVAERVTEYIKRYRLVGPIKIWLSGYSRAAAVSNLAGFEMIYGNLVEEDSLYAYTFATPRCAVNATSLECPGIFNIVGSFDPVPAVPFPEWGYERFGTTLYLPAQELCEDYEARKSAVDPVYRQITGLPYWNSIQTNWLCAKAMQSLDEVMSNAGSYRETLQQLTVDVMGMSGGALNKLYQVFRRVNANQPLKTMLEDITFNTDTLYSTVAYQLLQQWLGREAKWWDHGVSLFAEFIHEHCPDVYVGWLFSQDNGDALYIENIDYHSVILTGDFDVTVTDEQGKALGNPNAFQLGEERLVIVPAKNPCALTLTARSDTALKMLITERTAQRLYARLLLYGEEELPSDVRAGETLTLSLPAGTSAAAEQFALQSGQSVIVPHVDTQTVGFNSDHAALDTNYSGKTARFFLPRLLTELAIAAAVLLALLILLVIWLWRRAKRKQEKRETGRQKENASILKA